MQHLLNFPLIVEELDGIEHHTIEDCTHLTFYSIKGLAVGHDINIHILNSTAEGFVNGCFLVGDDKYYCEVAFMKEKEAFKIRMAEQMARIMKYQEAHPTLSYEEAAEAWIKKNGALFPKK